MTLLVATKVPSPWLNPKRRPIRFSERGIVIAADTRFTWEWRDGRLKLDDDAQKGFPLGDWTYAAYAGDAQLAEWSILGTYSACKDNGKFDNLRYILRALNKYLEYFTNRAEAEWGRRTEPTSVVVAAVKATARKERLKLYQLNFDTGFRPLERERIVIGDGRKYFESEVFDQEIDKFTKGKLSSARSSRKSSLQENEDSRAHRGKNELIEVPLLSVAGWIGDMVGRVIDDANILTVGGRVQLITLSGKGIYSPHVIRSSDGGKNWRGVTQHEDFRGHTDAIRDFTKVEQAEIVIPSLNEYGQFPDEIRCLTKIRTRPGSITGRVQGS